MNIVNSYCETMWNFSFDFNKKMNKENENLINKKLFKNQTKSFIWFNHCCYTHFPNYSAIFKVTSRSKLSGII